VSIVGHAIAENIDAEEVLVARVGDDAVGGVDRERPIGWLAGDLNTGAD
jgi:hypothetical protein